MEWLCRALTASSLFGNIVTDTISHIAVAGGGFLVAHGVFASCTQAQISAGQCSDYQSYLGSAIFLLGLGYKFAENVCQNRTKQALVAKAAAK